MFRFLFLLGLFFVTYFFCIGWWVGKAKYGVAIFGVGFILWCERSEHYKTNLENCLIFSGFQIFQVFCDLSKILVNLSCTTHCPKMEYNGMAAWRSGGIPALPFKSARPAAVAPNRLLSAVHFVPY